MKKLIYLIAIIGLFVTYSCGGSKTEKEDSTQKEEKLSESIKDCDDFLEHYEEWIDEYLVIIDSYFKDPSNEEIATKYMALMTEGMSWSTKWIALVDCAEDEEYEQRFEDISKKVEDKLTELGL